MRAKAGVELEMSEHQIVITQLKQEIATASVTTDALGIAAAGALNTQCESIDPLHSKLLDWKTALQNAAAKKLCEGVGAEPRHRSL